MFREGDPNSFGVHLSNQGADPTASGHVLAQDKLNILSFFLIARS